MENSNKTVDKKKIIIIVSIIIAILVVGISSFFIVKNRKESKKVETNYNEKNSNIESKEDEEFENKEEEKSSEDKENEKKASELLKGYSKTVNKDVFIEENTSVDKDHITLVDSIENDKQLIRKYHVTMNDITKNLEVRYTLNYERIEYLMLLDNKSVDEESSEISSGYTTMREVTSFYSDYFFKPENLRFFTGTDDKEYAILEFMNFPHSHAGGENKKAYIINDNFEKLSVHLNTGEKTEFLLLDNQGVSDNMAEYSSIIGYKTKRFPDKKVNLTLDKNKIKYFDINVECNIGTAEEYEFTIKENVISPQKIGAYEIHWNSASIC